MSLRVEDLLMLASVKLQPASAELEHIDALLMQVSDWDYFTKTIIDRGMAPLFYKKLPLLTHSAQIPAYVQNSLQQAYYRTFSRGAVLYEHFRRIATAFSAHNIDVVALKGIYLSECLYGDIGLRQLSDIDLLVHEGDGRLCMEILAELGYIPLPGKEMDSVRHRDEFIHYTPMVQGDISVEIHLNLHSATEPYWLDVDRFWQQAQAVKLYNCPVYTLQLNDQLIHLCVHLHKHFMEGRIQFSCFTDIVNVLDRYGNDIDWQALTDSCRRYGCETVVFKYIMLVHRYMQAPVPDVVLKNYSALLNEWVELIFVKYLKGSLVSVGFIPQHLVLLSDASGLCQKSTYILQALFPSRWFMQTKYKIKNPFLLFYYYPYRLCVGVKRFMAALKTLK